MQPTAEGTLANTPLAHLVVYCGDRKLSGGLILRPEADDDPLAADVITFDDGLPAKIRIADAVEHLGRIFVELGAIDDATYNASLMQLGQGGSLHGQILLSGGHIDAAMLERGLRTQLLRKLGHLLTVRAPTTRFAFYEGADFLTRYGGPEKWPTEPTGALLAGLRANPAPAHVERAMSKLAGGGVALRAAAPLAGLDFSRGERLVIDRLRAGAASVDELLTLGALDARTLPVFLYAALLLKLAEPVALGAPRSSMTGEPRISMSGVESRQSVPGMQAVAPRTSIVSSPSPPSSGAFASAPPAAPLAKSASPAGSNPPSGRASSMGMLSPEALVERADEIRERAATIDDQDLFKMLGLGRDSTPDEARAAFFQLAKKWHPDKLHVDLEHVRAELAKVFARLSEAHATLTDPEKRERYLRLYDQGGGTPKQQAEVAQLLEASTAYQKGAWFVGKGNFAEAEPFAMRAYELAPKEPDHVALYCWLLAQKPERRAAGKYDDLLFKLDAALAESPNCESGLYYRGMIRKLAGRTEGALADFRAVVAHNPKHLDAQREVRLFEMRKQQAAEQKAKDDAGGGLLGRFMKKK